jgi:hypothetical protein
MASVIGLIIYTACVGIVLGYFEIQIEGKNGWARKLPCWRKENGWVVKNIMGGRPLTSYHISLISLLTMILHSSFFLILWNWQSELFVLGLLLELLLFDDFFWFAINPHFGLKKFKKEEIWWHKHWIGPVPDFYIYLVIICAIFFYLGYAGIS